MDELIKLDQVDEIAINLDIDDSFDIDLGEVTGVVKPPETESLEVSATREEQIIKPSYNKYFDSVKVNPIPSQYADVSDTTATSQTVMQGKVFYDADGKRTEGVALLANELEDNIGYAKQMDNFDNILTGRTIVERDYTEQEIARLDSVLKNITQGEIVNG